MVLLQKILIPTWVLTPPCLFQIKDPKLSLFTIKFKQHKKTWQISTFYVIRIYLLLITSSYQLLCFICAVFLFQLANEDSSFWRWRNGSMVKSPVCCSFTVLEFSSHEQLGGSYMVLISSSGMQAYMQIKDITILKNK